MKDQKGTEVKVSIIQVILTAATPIGYRLDSLLRDYYREELALSDIEYTVLMEMRTASSTLSCLLRDYLCQAREYKVDKLTLSASEFKLIIELSKTVELAQHSVIGNTPLWVN